MKALIIGLTKASSMAKKPNTPFDVQVIMDDLRDTYVKTPRDQTLLDHFDRLLQCDQNGIPIAKPVTFTKNGETRGIVLIDGPGGGKTSLVDHALRVHPAFSAAAPNTMPVIKARVPSPATLKSLALEILAESGYEDVSDRRQRWFLWNLVRNRLEMLGTAVLWIDEAHDLFQSGTPSEVRDILKTLKSLMQGDGAVIVILTGIKSLWQIASYDGQVKRRYTKISLPDLTNAKDGKAISRQMGIFCDMAGLLPPDEADLVQRLIYASHNRFGLCIENILHGIELALKSGADQLEMQHFAEAWAMQEGCDYRGNVFLAPRWSEIDLAVPVIN